MLLFTQDNPERKETRELEVSRANKGKKAKMVRKVAQVIKESRELTAPMACQASPAKPGRPEAVALTAGEASKALKDIRVKLEPWAHAEFRARKVDRDKSENKGRRVSREKLANAENAAVVDREDIWVDPVSRDHADLWASREQRVKTEQQEIAVNVDIADSLENRARMELLDLQVPLDRLGRKVKPVNEGYAVPKACKGKKVRKENVVVVECRDPAGTLVHTVLLARQGNLAMATSMADTVASMASTMTSTTPSPPILVISQY